ncbi:winged helix-turn-helix transcriptional regulator [Streptomyces olivochromogenes]|uniref:winged helix-turn-helix transcriptional regulator n=1 Tax=Streptomyces olivochromogenes TaxID=1963 RepID=UPI001F480812|nr:helix-turn-helix domain-containing protein [Streptomyces olivochromogenes]MCF3137486.1 helix-turn-helix transcriptional regulator [Streptomyces olivochromogenes]
MTTPRHPQPVRRSEHPQSTGAAPAITRAFALLSRRWNGLILMGLAKGPADFAEIRERVPGISDRMLAQRLRELTAIDLVAQHVRTGPSSRAHYALSPHGNAFLIPLAALCVWAEDHLPASGSCSSASDQPAASGR